MSLALSAEPDVEDPIDPYAPFWPLRVEGEGRPARTEWDEFEDALLGGILAMRMSNYPTDENIAATIAWNPRSAPLLFEWKRIWDRSFPNGYPEEVLSHRNEGTGPSRREAAETDMRSALAKGHADHAAWHAWWLAANPPGSPDRPHGYRDWQAHVVDDAETLVSLRDATPEDAFVTLGYGSDAVVLVLERHDGDGVPIVAVRHRHSYGGAHSYGNMLGRIRPDDDAPYWRSEAFLAAAGRRFAKAGKPVTACMMLAAMARQGHRKAFLKGVSSKSGTWTVDLSDVRDAQTALVAFQRAVPPWDVPHSGLIVQEHVPFLREQRFFVVAGRIVASVCSDRHHSAVDARRDRILDERVARIVRPENDGGAYDRGVTATETDRRLSAAFARAARRLVRELAAEGIVDYVLDMGETERGVLPVELNSLYMSGPYSLDRSRIVRARNRLHALARGAVRRMVEEKLSGDGATPVAEDHDAFAAFPRRLDMKAVEAAIDARPLSKTAARCVAEKSKFGGPRRLRLGEGVQGLRTSVGEAVEAHMPRRFTDDAGLRPVGGLLEDAAFALMPGFEPLFSVVYEGLERAGETGVPVDDRRWGYGHDHLGWTTGRVCGGVLHTPEGAVLAMATAVDWNGGIHAVPAGRSMSDPFPGFGRPVFKDRRGRVFSLTTQEDGGRTRLLVELRLEDRTEELGIPGRGNVDGGLARMADWVLRDGVPVAVAPGPADPEEETDPKVETSPVEDEDEGSDPFFLEIGARGDDLPAFDIETVDPGGDEGFERRSKSAGDRRRRREDGSERVATWLLADEESERRAVEAAGCPAVVVMGFDLPPSEDGAPWTDCSLVVCEAGRSEFETAYKVAVAGRRGDVWDAGVVDYRARPMAASRNECGLVKAVRLSSNGGGVGTTLLRTRGQEIVLWQGWSAADAAGRRHRILAVVVMEGRRMVGYRETPLHTERSELGSPDFESHALGHSRYAWPISEEV